MAHGDGLRRVTDALRAYGLELQRGRCPCPAHGGYGNNGNNLSVRQGTKGAALKCHSHECPTADILAAIGLPVAAQFDDFEDSVTSTNGKRELVATFYYIDELNGPAYRIHRWEWYENGKREKSFSQERWDAAARKYIGGAGAMKGVRRVLYRLPNVLAAIKAGETVYVHEGEKAADALRERFGLTCTTSPEGAGKWSHENAVPPYAESLRGAHVVLLPDNEDKGRKHMASAAGALLGIAASVRVLALPGLPEKGDVVEWLAAGGTREQLEALASATSPASFASFASEDETPLSVARFPNPPDSAAFHGVLGEIVGILEPTTEGDPTGILCSLLAGFGNTLNRGPYFQVGAGRHCLNLFLLNVGATAVGRKGVAWEEALYTLRQADPDWAADNITSGLSSGEGLIWEVRDPIERTEPIREKGKIVDYQTVIVDPGVKDKRRLILETEFSKTLKVMARDGNTLSQVVRQAWDHGDLRAMTKNSQARATGAHITIVGHIPPFEFQRLLDRLDVSNGFLNRFLIVAVKRSKSLPEGGQPDAMRLAEPIMRLRAAIDFGRRTGFMERDDAARSLWAVEYDRLTEGRAGPIGAATSRAAPQVMRIACLYALLDQSNLVRVAHLRAALALHAYVERSVEFVFGETLGDPIASSVLTALRENPDGLTRTELYNRFSRHLDKKQADTALKSLAREGLAEQVTEKTGGRPRELWRVAKKAKEARKAAIDEPVVSLSSLSSQPASNGAVFDAHGGSALTEDEVQRRFAANRLKRLVVATVPPDEEAI
jgi:hypothetical protein